MLQPSYPVIRCGVKKTSLLECSKFHRRAARATNFNHTEFVGASGHLMSDKRSYYQPGEDVGELRHHPEFGISEDCARLLIRSSIDASLREHEKQVMSQLDSKFSELTEMIKSAFPNGDPHGHRKAHEQEIKDSDGWSRLKADLVSKVMTGGVWAGLVWVAFAVIEAIKQEIKK